MAQHRNRGNDVRLFAVIGIVAVVVVAFILFSSPLRDCGNLLARNRVHEPLAAATCTEPSLCRYCDTLLEESTGHTSLAAATCTEPELCRDCGVVLAEALGHSPGAAATCDYPERCSVCQIVLREALGHQDQYSADGLTATCSICHRMLCRTQQTKDQALVAEAVPEGHYHNQGGAYMTNSVLVCGDYAMESFRLGTGGSGDYAAAVSTFAAAHPEVTVTSLLIPKACAFLAPEGGEKKEENQRAFISATYDMMGDGVVKVDAISELAEHAGEYMYYRTDHHWTSLGAYYAAVAYCRVHDLDIKELSEYQTVIRTGYIGSFYGFANQPASLRQNPDYTVAHLPAASCSVSILTGGVERPGVLLDTEAKGYAGMFLGGDHALLRIDTDRETGRKLMVLKESYGNAFVPYMADYYDQILVVDIRHDVGSLNQLIQTYGITDVLIINNVQAVQSLLPSLRARLAS